MIYLVCNTYMCVLVIYTAVSQFVGLWQRAVCEPARGCDRFFSTGKVVAETEQPVSCFSGKYLGKERNRAFQKKRMIRVLERTFTKGAREKKSVNHHRLCFR